MNAPTYGECTVCGRVLDEHKEYGRRQYCPLHLAAFVEDIATLWRANILTLGGMTLMAIALVLASQLSSPNTPLQIDSAAGAGLLALPAALWLVFLYQNASRRRTYLSPLLPTILILSALTAAAAVRPLLFQIIDLDQWLAETDSTHRFLGHILVNGMMNAFALYALVRYTIWQTPDFSHRADGVLYALAAAWGYGTAMVALSALNEPSLTALNGGLKSVAQLCAYLASGLVIGYFLGRNRFEDMPLYYMSAGVVLAAALNGLLLYAGTELNSIGLSLTRDGFSPWPGIAFNSVLLILTHMAVHGLTRRHNALTKARIEATQ